MRRQVAVRTPGCVAKRSAPRPLTGGNPQVAEADGDAPVRVYVAAMPRGKHEGERLDEALVGDGIRHVPRHRGADLFRSCASRREGGRA